MQRSLTHPNVAEYLKNIQDLMAEEARLLTSLLPHSGERGRHDEERVRQFLRRVLPRKFSIGSGFIVFSNKNKQPSTQTDIVIYDEFYNSPLFRGYYADIHPIETVYGTVEVKYCLNKEELIRTLDAKKNTRSLAEDKRYYQYGIKGEESRTPIVSVDQISRTLPPRAFIFSYTSSYSELDKLLSVMQELVPESGAHIHGLLVLEKDWYISQVAYSSPPDFQCSSEMALIHFVHNMLSSISSMPMAQVAFENYLSANISDKTGGR